MRYIMGHVKYNREKTPGGASLDLERAGYAAPYAPWLMGRTLFGVLPEALQVTLAFDHTFVTQLATFLYR